MKITFSKSLLSDGTQAALVFIELAEAQTFRPVNIKGNQPWFNFSGVILYILGDTSTDITFLQSLLFFL